MTLEQNLMLKAFTDKSFVELIRKNKAYDPDDIFEGIRKAIAAKEMVTGVDCEYNGVISFSIPYKERSMPEFVDDEEWEKLWEKHHDDASDKSRFQMDDDEYFKEYKYGTHWSQRTETSWFELKFVLDGELWKVEETEESKKIGGHNSYESEDLYDILKEIGTIAYNSYEGDDVDNYKHEEWDQEVEDKAEELGLEELPEPYNPEYDKQQKLKFEELLRILLNRS
jgi:hypothetical protein